MHELFRFILGEIRGAWRFRWYALGAAWLVALAGAFVVLTMPDKYRVEARIQMNTESVLKPLLADLAVQPDIEQHMAIMTATLLNRQNLERIASENDLLIDARSEAEEERLIDNLGSEINIRDTQRDRIYRISYTHSEPGKAQGVVQSTMDLLMEKAVSVTMDDASSATKFLEREVAEYEQQLREAEQKLAKFKRENVGLLPNQGGGDFYQRLSRTEEEIESLESDLRIARRRANSLQQQMQSMRQGQSPQDVRDPRLASIDQEIRDSQRQLDELLQRYTDQHPDVKALRRRIERQKERREEIASQSDGGGRQRTANDLQDNPAYQEFQLRYNDVQSEIASIQTRLEQKRNRRQELLAKVDEITEVEARLQDLTRNYENTQERYQQLLSRLRNAQMTAEADRSGNQMNLRVVDPPRTPEAPDGPPRDLYLLALLPMSFGIGGGVGYLLHQIRPVFQTRAQLAEVSGRPVLGSVSLVMTRRQRRTKLFAVLVFLVAAMSLVAAAGVAAVFDDTSVELAKQLMRRMPL